MSYKRGDVVLVLFPDSNLHTAKRRPALVVQADGLQTGLPQVLVAMITSNMARSGPACRIAVPLKSPLNKGSGLRTDSVVMADNLATVLNAEVDRSIGTFTDMPAVDGALRKALAI